MVPQAIRPSAGAGPEQFGLGPPRRRITCCVISPSSTKARPRWTVARRVEAIEAMPARDLSTIHQPIAPWGLAEQPEPEQPCA